VAVSVLRARLVALTFPPAPFRSRSAGAGPGVRAARSSVFHRVGRDGFQTRPY
jgi:hypothetical protein